MPFTLSHPAAVLLLKDKFGKWLNFAGLVIGSLVPDFEYYVRGEARSIYGHTILGVIYFDLPIALIMYMVWIYIIKPAQIFWPFDYNTEREKQKIFNTKFLYTLLISMLIGISTHLLWDSFTHVSGFFVKNFVSLGLNINLLGYTIPIYKLLQHVSSIIGFFIIIVFLFKNSRNVVKFNNLFLKKIRLMYAGLIILCTISLIFLCGYFKAITFSHNGFVTLVIISVDSFFVSLLFFSFIFNIFFKSYKKTLI